MLVLLVDDHPVFAEALGARLATEPDIEVLPVVSDGDGALGAIGRARPDVVLLDLVLGAASGLTVLDEIRARYPDTKVIMLTAVEDPDQTVAAVRRGAAAWLPKSVHADDLVRVLRGVVRGEAWMPPKLLAEVLQRLTQPADPERDPLSVLTDREREVLQCMVDGLSRAEIAARLYVSMNTARTHTQNILVKLHCHSVLEAVSLARRHGMH
ncbi:response regulator transcription factor [Longispora sp. K20-0274]|uniref:response regulator n=1 Tax=Longispora sp. K20-0274 TaxID=3088255 RepID=UPI00399A1DA3